MVAQETMEELARFYKAFNAGGGLEAFRAFVHPKFVYRTRPEFPDGGEFTLEAALERVSALREVFDDLCWEPQEFIDAGDRVVVVVRQFGRGHSSHVAIEHSVAHLWVFAADKAKELHVYSERDEALEATRLTKRPD